MRRIFWLALGLGAGATAAVMASRWMRKKTEAMAPANIGREIKQGATDVASLARAALVEGRRGMREKEAEIRASLEA